GYSQLEGLWKFFFIARLCCQAPSAGCATFLLHPPGKTYTPITRLQKTLPTSQQHVALTLVF
ncbi:MAG TPA: hypothetical protein VJ453_04815, partial [Terriglobales bacterium]|nr:hypothetical protein [Terriglobales bacterium]